MSPYDSSLPPTPADQETRDVAELLAQAAFIVTAHLTRLASDHDLSLTQLRVFGILRDRTPRVVELADFLGLEKSTISGFVGRAEKRGILRKIPDPQDARASLIEMTDEGHRLEQEILGELHSALKPLTAQLSARDSDRFAELLARLLQLRT